MKVSGTAEEIMFVLSKIDKEEKVEVFLNFNQQKCLKSNSGRKGIDKTEERWQQPEFYKAVKIKLTENSMTFSELCNEIGITPSYLSQILLGHRKGKAAQKMLKEVSEVLGVEII